MKILADVLSATILFAVPLLLVAGLMYLVNGMLDLMFLLYCIIPAVMAFVAFYQMNRTPRLKPPRLI